MSTSESVTKKARALVSTESTGVKMAGPLSSFTGWECEGILGRGLLRGVKSHLQRHFTHTTILLMPDVIIFVSLSLFLCLFVARETVEML